MVSPLCPLFLVAFLAFRGRFRGAIVAARVVCRWGLIYCRMIVAARCGVSWLYYRGMAFFAHKVGGGRGGRRWIERAKMGRAQ